MVGRAISGAVRVLVIYLLIVLFFVGCTSGKVAYDVGVDVDGTSWGVDRSTQNFNFNVEGNVIGSGNFSRNNCINGISGLSYNERSSVVRGGNISIEESMQLVAKEGPVLIKYGLQSAVLNSSNSTKNEYGQIAIDERWTTHYKNYKKISYLGEGGLKTFERYNDNGEIISTYTDSWRLSRESIYASFNNRTVIQAKIAPGSVMVDRASNKSSLYFLDLKSMGSLTRIDLMSIRPTDESVLSVSEERVSRNFQEYAGYVETKLTISDRWIMNYPSNVVNDTDIGKENLFIASVYEGDSQDSISNKEGEA